MAWQIGRECCVFISGFCTHGFYFFLTLVLPNSNYEIINFLSYFLVFDQGIIFLYILILLPGSEPFFASKEEELGNFIAKKLAKRIVLHRDKCGIFTCIEQVLGESLMIE